jgi:glutamate dehydrogenase
VLTTFEDDKADLLTRAADAARHSKGSGGPDHDQVEDLLAAYYRHVAAEDLVERSPEDLYGALASHHRLARTRPQGTAAVRVITPRLAESGWSAGGHSVVEVVTDDMPFLVDSVTMELARLEHTVHVVIHPQFAVTRDITGELQTVGTVEEGVVGESAPDAFGESWMHVEIDRVVDEADVALI